MIIRDLDKPFYKLGLIYQIDINNYFDIRKKQILQRLKYFLIYLFIIFNIVKLIIYSLIRDYIDDRVVILHKYKLYQE